MTEPAVSKSQRARIGGRLVLVLMSLAVATGVIEIALRVARYRPALSSAWMLGNPDRILEEDLVTIDRRFVHESYYQPAKERGPAKLLVALGDSFTASFPVASNDSYPSVLERTLAAHSFDVRVLNVGMGDTGTDQQLKLFINYVLPRVQPDIVVWQFYPNDTYENAIKPVYTMGDDNVLVPISGKDNWMYRRKKFFDAVPLPARVKKSSYLFNLLLRPFERSLEAQVPAGKEKLTWGRHKIERGMARMNELAAQHGFRVYYTLITPEAMYLNDVPQGSAGAAEAVEYDKLLGIVEKEPTFIYGRFSSMTLEDTQLAVDLFSDGTRDPSLYGTRHLNEAGYRLIAERVANRVLRDNGLLPAPAQSAAVSTAPILLRLGDTSARRFLRRGWQRNEPAAEYLWSDGLQSLLDVTLPRGGEVRMDFECRPLSYPGSPRQTLSIVFNGKAIQQLTLDEGRSSYSVILPVKEFRDRPDTIEFHYSFAQRPVDVIAGNTDSRSLAVVWYSIEFTPIR